MRDTTLVLLFAAFVAALVTLFAGVDTDDVETWNLDGDCVTRIYDDRRWLWIDDHKTVETYCKAAGR